VGDGGGFEVPRLPVTGVTQACCSPAESVYECDEESESQRPGLVSADPAPGGTGPQFARCGCRIQSRILMSRRLRPRWPQPGNSRVGWIQLPMQWNTPATFALKVMVNDVPLAYVICITVALALFALATQK
jgi:hypothetical protein